MHAGTERELAAGLLPIEVELLGMRWKKDERSEEFFVAPAVPGGRGG